MTRLLTAGRCWPAGFFLFACLAICLGLTSCSGPEAKTDEAELRLRRIGQAYVLVMDVRRRPPRTVEELKDLFKELDETRAPDTLLQSPRDGQPYVIVFGVSPNATDRSTILAYEREGKDGKRYVLTLSSDIRVLTDEEFASAQFAGGHRPTRGK